VAIRRVVERLLEQPWLYAVWQAPFVAQKFAPVERHLENRDVRRVLDVGCGPATNARRFAGADYVGVDINEHYLARARAKHPGRFVQADLQTADLSSLGTFDTILVNSFLHHLPDEAVGRILRQLQKLLEPEGRVHMLELVLPEERSVARLMARLDRGRYARPLAAWRDLLVAHFDPLVFETYSVGGGLWAMLYFQGGGKSCGSR
jgi:SAM-dependent methyltransferase